ncbi:YciI family protein [Streptomyces boninensis]|uniref:YciI family protein n=1 Tax=Streptomyces boninensis TaxID=2039455 RepID=UPI003B21E870
MKYVLMFADDEKFAAELAAMSDAERGRAYQRVYDWLAANGDKITYHSKLQDPQTATTVRLGDGEPVVVDGPYVEGKEVVSGIAEIDVADLDEALRMVRDWPGCPVVEVRPVLAVPGRE